MKKIIFSVDVEPDLHSGEYKSIREGLTKFEGLCDKHSISPVLFVVGEVIEPNKGIFRRLHKKGWDISMHGYTHKRFDDMPLREKEKELGDSLKAFKKNLGVKPKGFRAPQHSIDGETLDLLERLKISFDSSFTPFNLLQVIFFPKRVRQAFRHFFSRPNPYKIRKNLTEIPVPSLLIPPVSLTVRVFPKWFLFLYFKTLKIVYRQPVFYAHSWDFIELKESRIDRMFPSSKFLNKLDYVMSL